MTWKLPEFTRHRVSSILIWATGTHTLLLPPTSASWTVEPSRRLPLLVQRGLQYPLWQSLVREHHGNSEYGNTFSVNFSGLDVRASKLSNSNPTRQSPDSNVLFKPFLGELKPDPKPNSPKLRQGAAKAFERRDDPRRCSCLTEKFYGSKPSSLPRGFASFLLRIGK
jgi:hypothetical protein